MNPKPNSKKLIAGTVVAVLLLLGAVIYQAILNSRFRLVSSTPGITSTVATSLPGFVLEFNRDLDESVAYKKQLSGPDEIVDTIKINKRSLLVFTSQTEDGKRYEFSITNIKAKDGTIIPRVDFKFRAKYIAATKLSKAERKLVTTLSLKAEYPILNFLPYGGINFSLSGYSNDEGRTDKPVVLVAQLYLSGADVRFGKDAAVEKYKKEVADFITSKGFTPSDYEINYEIVNQSL